MRKRTDQRRQALLDVAAEMFSEQGYGRVSMAAIAAKAGRSKATLYNYFKSKEELFAAVMVDAMEERGLRTVGLLDPSDQDLRAVLERFGEAYLDFLLDREGLGATRTAIAETGRSALGARLYALGPQRFRDEVTRYIELQMARGALAAGSASLAALHLQGLLEAGVIEPALFGAEPPLERGKGVKAAVDLFLRDYAASRLSGPGPSRDRRTTDLHHDL